MTTRVASGVAGAILTVATLVLLAAGVGETTPGDDFGLGGVAGASFLLAAIGFGTVGATILHRIPGHAVGRIFVATAVVVGIGDFTYQYADHALYGTDAALPLAEAAAWMQNLGLPPAFGLLALAVLRFPDGRPATLRWRWAPLLPATGIVLLVLAYALRSGPLDPPFGTVTNPVGVPGTFDVFESVAGVGWLLSGGGALLAGISIALRLRSAQGTERLQLRWIALAGAFLGVAIAADVATFFLDLQGIGTLRLALVGLSFTTFPLAAGAAILRYRLYDIDVVVNRALVYAALTVTLVAAYLVTVLLAQLVLPDRSDFGVAISTLAAAAVFAPARRWLQAAVDRRFFRRRYDVTRTLATFGARLRDEVDLDALSDELRAVVADTVQPAHVSLWLRP